MGLSFNTSGNLHKDIELSIEELGNYFTTNSGRKKKLDNALLFFGIFHSCGCQTVYIGGSFVSTKQHPSDIDLCFDLTSVDYQKLQNDFPDFFDFNKLGEIKRNTGCHILYFDRDTTYLLKMLQEDRDGFRKGLVKLKLKNFTS